MDFKQLTFTFALIHTLPVDLLCVYWLRSRQSGLLVIIIEIHVPENAPGRSIAVVDLGCLPDLAMLWRMRYLPPGGRVANWATFYIR